MAETFPSNKWVLLKSRISQKTSLMAKIPRGRRSNYFWVFCGAIALSWVSMMYLITTIVQIPKRLKLVSATNLRIKWGYFTYHLPYIIPFYIHHTISTSNHNQLCWQFSLAVPILYCGFAKYYKNEISYEINSWGDQKHYAPLLLWCLIGDDDSCQ